MKTFVDKLMDAIQEKQSILCVGLDPQVRYIPEHILEQGYEMTKDPLSLFEPAARAFVIFFEDIIKATAPFAAIAKPQMAFYEAYKHWGVWAFEEIVKLCRRHDLLVLEDAKRSDGGDTAKAYAAGHLGKVDVWDPVKSEIVKRPSFDVDAMTVMPGIGTSCLSPFVEVVKEFGKGIFVVDKTSFRPNSEVEQLVTKTGRKVWEETALLVKQWSEGCEGESGINNIGVVMGATYPEEAVTMRELLPNCFFLVPGYGAQGGGADGAVKGGRVIVNSSRGIDYAFLRKFKCDPKDFAQAAEKSAKFARDDLNQALKRAGKIPW
ncbi:orotidine-5'-phosphate decarboxylase [Patescibacteria group bacterium]|nr:orotidine-5'-phosphate decarboxylase [Patescibacteria group bacterium]